MWKKSFTKTLLGSGALLFLAACDMSAVDQVPVSPGAALVAPADPAPVPAAAPPVTQSYDKIETFQSASPGYNSAAGRRNGLTMTSGRSGAAETGAAQAPKNQNRLVADAQRTVSSGGTAQIVVTGNTDAQHQNTDNSVLAKDRAKAAAEKLAKEIGNGAKVVPSTAACGSASVCIVYQANPRANNNANVGRNATAVATFTSPPPVPDTDLCCFPSGGGGGGSGTSDGGTIPGGSITIPGTSGGGSGGGSAGGSEGSLSNAPDFEDFYPGEITPEDAKLRIVVSASPQFRVGGALRPEIVEISSVDVMCGSVVCTSPASPDFKKLTADWSITSSASVYKFCATSRSTSCQFYLTSASVSRFTFPSLQYRMVIGFISPTPGGVVVQPSLTLGSVDVRAKKATWVGGPGCDESLPARSCWTFEEGDVVSLPVTVVSNRGEVFTRSGDTYFMRRNVTGSTGS